MTVQKNIKWENRKLFKPQKRKTGPVFIDDKSSSSSVTRKKATGKEYVKRKQTNGFTVHNLQEHVRSLSKNPPKGIITPSN